MDTGPISSATAVISTQYTTSYSSAATMSIALSSTLDIDQASTTTSTDPSISPGPVTSPYISDVGQASATTSTGPSPSAPPAAPVSASPSDASFSSAGRVSTAQSTFLIVAGTYTTAIPASEHTTMITVTSMVSSPRMTMSTHVTIPTVTTTLPTPAKPYATADSKHHISYEKQHKNQIIGGAVGGFVAVLLVMGLLLWLYVHLRRKWMTCKRRCQILGRRRTSSNDSKSSGDSGGVECCLKCIPKKVRFKDMCLPRCCRLGIAEGDDFMQELETRPPTEAPRFSNIPHRRPARYASFFGHSGNQDFQTPNKAPKSRHEKEASRHTTLKVSNPDPNAPVPSDSGSSASKDAAAAPGFVAGPEYDPGDPDAIHTIPNEPSAGMKSGHSLYSDWGIKSTPEKRKSLSPLKPAVLSKSNSRPKPKKSILKKHRKHSPDLPVESSSESKESEEASNASSSGEGPSKPPSDNLKYSFEDFESRLGSPETVSSTADIGMLELKDLTSPQRETSPIPSRIPYESPDPTQTLQDSIDQRAEMRKRKSGLRGSADSKQGMDEDRKGSKAGQQSFADDHDKPESAIHSEARGGGIGDTESQTEHPQDCAENPSPSEQAGSPSKIIEMADTGQKDGSTGGGDQAKT